MKGIGILSILLALTLGLSAAEPLEITATINKNSLTTGNFLIYQIEVTHPPDLQVQPILLEEYVSEGIDVELMEFATPMQGKVKKFSWVAKLWPFGEKEIPKTRFSWRLWPLQEGTWTIPEIEITSLSIESSEHSSRILGETEALSFTVHSLFQLDPENPELPVLKINQELPPSPFSKGWIWFLLAGIAVLLAVLFYLFYKHRKPPALIEEEELSHQRALRRLRKLRQFISTNPQEVHHYYLMLSEIFREFLENQFGFSATSMTTQEFLPFLQGETPYSAEEQEQIVLLTQKSDLVKYAEGLSTQKEMEAAYNQVVLWIERIAFPLFDDSEVELPVEKVEEVA